MCHDAFYNNGSISIVLEYVDAGSLADIMEELEPKCFPEPNLAVVCKQDEVKISEFGVGAVLANSTTREDRFVITLVYISPAPVAPADQFSPEIVLSFQLACRKILSADPRQQNYWCKRCPNPLAALFSYFIPLLWVKVPVASKVVKQVY
ncbi:mitogen-activated protein kinase kinase 1a-like [Physcomitrium patens]|uniref:mitogen-activated protein kinase kinase 1a-like n=1 Tax=Physcomitrium patens TaxID=3218 RepID=UPI003CCE47BB